MAESAANRTTRWCRSQRLGLQPGVQTLATVRASGLASLTVMPLCCLADRDVWPSWVADTRILEGTPSLRTRPHVREWSEGQVGLNLRPAVGFRHRDRVAVDALFLLQCAP